MDLRYYSYNRFNEVDSVYEQLLNRNKRIYEVNKFDNNGKLIEKYQCLEKTGCKLHKRNEYNSSGLLIRELTFKDNEIESEQTYKYDNVGNRVEQLSSFKGSSSRKSEFHFNDSKKIIQSIDFSPAGKVLDNINYSYDNAGHLTHITGGPFQENTFYSYDSDGNETEYKSIGQNGQLSEHSVSRYQNGLIAMRIHYTNEIVELYSVFEYEKY